MIAALFVEANGVYSNIPDVDCWDIKRDARLYAGPYPVVAHPPCERWGRYWSGGPSVRVRRELGSDGGCFESALSAVRFFGGVLEHPEASHAWRAFGINEPPKSGGWIAGDLFGGFTCCVEQGHYGHPARKATWLYAFAVELPCLKWGSSGNRRRLDGGFHSTAERHAARARGEKPLPRLSARECAATPPEFRDVLLDMARSANQGARRKAVRR
jgi:hypothetical protein